MACVVRMGQLGESIDRMNACVKLSCFGGSLVLKEREKLCLRTDLFELVLLCCFVFAGFGGLSI